MDAPARTLPHCSYDPRDVSFPHRTPSQAGTLHQFTFNTPSRRAVDEWLRHLENAYAALPAGQTLRCVIDYRTRGIPHLSYGTGRVRQWLLHHPNHAPMRCAFIHSNYALATILEGVTRLLKLDDVTIRFFHAYQRQTALDWVLAE